MHTIYKSQEGKEAILSLYEEQLKKLSCDYQELYVMTSYGKTHLIITGNPDGIPLLVFHGGNATTAYNLLACSFLMNDFHLYAVDTIGHPGKSAQNSLSPRGNAYGKWAAEVIDQLGFSSICGFAGSFGAGILAKAMCVAPKKIKRAVLYVPSGICNAVALRSINMLFPMILYWTTHQEKWLKKCIMPMAVSEENITDDIYETAKRSIDYAKIKKGMPGNVSAKQMKKCYAKTLVMAGEKDCLFPADKVIPRAEKIIPNVETYLLKARGHMNLLTEAEKDMIVKFLKNEEA